MKHNKTLFIFLAALLLLFAGCGISPEPKGIYYPALSHTFLKTYLFPASMKAGEACYSADAFKLYYNGEVYTRSHFYQEYSQSDLPMDTLGQELCTVYGNEKIHWADKEEDLAACTHIGTLYRMAGYDENFRVGLYYEEPARVDMGHGPIYHLYIFERTNNLTLHTGKDYYTNLYHFPTDASLDNLDMDDTDVKAFVDALLAAEFIDPSDESLPAFDFSTDKTYYFQFTDSLGLRNSVAIFENGYVVDSEDHNFILKLDPSLCQSVINQLHQPEWPGEYKYVTYSYDREQDIRTEYKYQLTVTESDTDLIFDLCVTRTDAPVHFTGTPIDIPVVTGPVVKFSIPKEAALQQHTIFFVSQKYPETAPELIEYIELKKGLQEDIISLRYAASKEELEELKFVTLNKQ